MSLFKKLLGALGTDPAAPASASAAPMAPPAAAPNGDAPAPSLDAQLRQLATAFAMQGLDKQSGLIELLADADWQVDLDAQRLHFSNGLDCRVQAMGSYAFQSSTLLWSWANTQANWPAAVMADARALADYGRTHQLPLLQAPEAVHLPEESSLHLLGCVASMLSGADGYYLANYGTGTLLCNLYLPDSVARPAAPPPGARELNIIPQAISLFEMDHRPALKSYLAAKGFALQEDAQQLVATHPSGVSIQARFNDQGLLQSLDGGAGQG